jgi:PhnB protein
MVTVIPTLHCGGRTEEAIAIYKRAFNLKVDFMGKDEQTNRVYHTETHIGEQRIRISDGGPAEIQNNSLFLAIVFETDGEVEKAFDILSDGGTVIQPPHPEDFASCMSIVRDKFGYKWFLMT